MSSLNLNEVLTRIDELRSLFELGQRTMPFLEELFHFLEEIEPLLDEINTSIRESTSKMPDAKSKLESVSEATEMATTEILDLVDSVAFELKMMQRALTRKTEGLDAVREADERLLHLLKQELGDEYTDLLNEVERIHRRKQPLLDEAIDHADDELEAVDDVRQKMTQITMALQVQDITSQQIAAANHIIESLRDRMAQLVYNPGFQLDEKAVPTDDAPEASDDAPEADDAAPEADAAAPEERTDAREEGGDGTFDGNARYQPGGNHQHIADELIDSIKHRLDDDAAPPEEPANTPEPTVAPPEDPPADTAEPGGDGEIAQEDIDELFS